MAATFTVSDLQDLFPAVLEKFPTVPHATILEVFVNAQLEESLAVLELEKLVARTPSPAPSAPATPSPAEAKQKKPASSSKEKKRPSPTAAAPPMPTVAVVPNEEKVSLAERFKTALASTEQPSIASTVGTSPAPVPNSAKQVKRTPPPVEEPLAEDFKEIVSATGERFFWSPARNVTSWQRPTAVNVSVLAETEGVFHALPPRREGSRAHAPGAPPKPSANASKNSGAAGVKKTKPRWQTLNGTYPDGVKFKSPVERSKQLESEDEAIILTDARLSSCVTCEDGEKPQHRLTEYAIYTKDGYLVPLDCGLLEKDVPLYACGVIKPVYDEDPLPGDWPVCTQIGPLASWHVEGYAEGGDRAIISIESMFADYKLLGNPSEAYRPFMRQVLEKAALSKAMIAFLQDHEGSESATYEALLARLLEIPAPTPESSPFTEDDLLTHMKYLLDHVWDFDQYAQESANDVKLFDSPAIQYLNQLEGGGVTRARQIRRGERSGNRRRRANGEEESFRERHFGMKATVTPVVETVFSEYFKRELDSNKRVEDDSWMAFTQSRHGCPVYVKGATTCWGIYDFPAEATAPMVLVHPTNSTSAESIRDKEQLTSKLTLAAFERSSGSKAKKARESVKFADTNASLHKTAEEGGWILEDDGKGDEDQNDEVEIQVPEDEEQEDGELEDDETKKAPKAAGVKKTLPSRAYFKNKCIPALKSRNLLLSNVAAAQIKVLGNPRCASQDKAREYFEAIQYGPVEFRAGDFLLYDAALQGSQDTVGLKDDNDLWLIRLNFVFRQGDRIRFNGMRFAHGQTTVMGRVASPREVFALDQCTTMDFAPKSVFAKVTVMQEFVQANWSDRGNLPEATREQEIADLFKDCGDVKLGEDAFMWKLTYDPKWARFTYPSPTDDMIGLCLARSASISDAEFDLKLREFYVQQQVSSATGAFEGVVLLRGKPIERNSCVLLKHDAYELNGDKAQASATKSRDDEIVAERTRRRLDPTRYPELWRKTEGRKPKGSHDGTKPMRVAIVERIYEKEVETEDDGEATATFLTLRKLYRPEETHLGEEQGFTYPERELFWSDETIDIQLDARVVKERASASINPHSSDLDLFRLTLNDQDEDEIRFVVRSSYDSDRSAFAPLSDQVLLRFQGEDEEDEEDDAPSRKRASSSKKGKAAKKAAPASEPTSIEPLALLDIFAGCGGLSAGLHQAGVCESKWAIEFEPPAAKSFKDNHPDAEVFCDDCNVLLSLAIDGAVLSHKGQRLPQRGEVKALAGGPPCQGFSGMNRFNAGQYSRFKNSLVATYLSYCDFYRPRLFLLENVKNFAQYHEGIVVQMCLRALTEMGYQCTFGCLQAGSYGVAQTRRRCVIMAAAPGDGLPRYPEPTHTFTKIGTHINVNVNGYTICPVTRVNGVAPLRRMTVRDVMGDLPPVELGETRELLAYDKEPMSDFQRRMRIKSSAVLTNHMVKKYSALVHARFERIPPWPGADWRDLPNEVVRLDWGLPSATPAPSTVLLEYPERTEEQLTSKSGHGGVGHTPQDNTIIPWCLPHTGNRHNNWAGLYGRLDWAGHFGTTVTNPEPMGKQGVVVHPDQHRVVSVRECARSQGFPDEWIIAGNIIDRHRQIGNAVPPPLARAIGRQWRKILAETQRVTSSNGGVPAHPWIVAGGPKLDAMEVIVEKVEPA